MGRENKTNENEQKTHGKIIMSDLKINDSLSIIENESEEIPTPDKKVSIGQWYWVKEKDRTWLGCAVHIGTNYIKVEGIHYNNRIHVDDFFKLCEFEPDASAYLSNQVQIRKGKIQALIQQVQDITARLSLQQNDSLPETTSTQALSTLGVDLHEHKNALIKAKEEDLPKLFEKIKDVTQDMTRWMTAQTIPLKAQAGNLGNIIETIEQRIFHVELYAGIVEEVIQFASGEPADVNEKLHIFQRRHYMDEECLVNYQAGGMDFKSIASFDRWLKKKKNRKRIFPFPKCMLAFKIRRNKKDRHDEADGSLSGFIRICAKEREDAKTYLYIRNGENLYCIRTSIEFAEKLFPDIDHSQLEGLLYFNKDFSNYSIIGQHRYESLYEEYIAAKKRYKKDCKREKDEQYYKDLKKGWGHQASLEHFLWRIKAKHKSKPYNQQRRYEPLTQDSVYYDDAMKQIAKSVDAHNRIALLLQGLFDRSPILLPHDKIKLWTQAGFENAIKLIYDTDKAIEPGKAPDFEKYRQKLNASLCKGCITVGQEDFWLHLEAKKINAKHDFDERSWHPYKRYRPYGNPGPGLLARVSGFRPKKSQCIFRWKRERIRYNSYKDEWINTSLTIDSNQLLNISAYKPGDFKRFYKDHRTRAEYLKWAPLLLAAEDYYAGKRKLNEKFGNDEWK